MSATITVIERATVVRINEAHQACQRAYGDALTHAIEAGRLLADVKRQLGHGEFGAWIEEHFDGSGRTAQVYMQLASAPQVANAQHAADLSLRGALQQVSEPKARRATAGDATSLLQGLAGSAPSAGELPARVDAARDRLKRESAWTDPQTRKADRAADDLVNATDALEDARRPGLSPYAIAEGLRQAAIEARKAAAVIDELAFTFER